MATKHDEFKVYYFSFNKEELIEIVDALRAYPNDKLADEICDEMGWGDEPEGVDADSNIASLIFDIDCSAAGKATEELAKLKDAVSDLTEAYERLNEAQKRQVEYSLDATDRLIKELLAGVSR